ncbi:MAG TPA: hypothetical protein VGU01_08160, partial [Sphingomicrobium sp.]|nr:hypothetical protein [Sphingomicrobium sp.]
MRMRILPSSTRAPMFLALLATGISLSANLAVLFGFSADDTYIVERYAKNATSAHELSYNLGEKIDALTSPLHALLMIIYSVSAVSPLLLNKMISLIAVGIAALIGAREMGRHQVLIHPSMRGGSDGAGWIFAAAIATSPFVLLWAVAGLETSYVLLLIALLTFLVRTPSPSGLGNRRLVLLGLLVGTAFLGRFDTVVFTGPIVLFALAQRRFGPSAVLSLLPGAALAGAWLLFAWFYYHDIFPTSLYVKPPNLAGTNVIHNIVYIGQFLVFTGVAAPFIAVLIS